MDQQTLSRRAFLASAAASGTVGCLGSDYPHHDFNELVKEGLEQYEGEDLSTTGYVERSNDTAYFYFTDPTNGQELTRPVDGTYELFDTPEPVPGERSLYVLDHHVRYALPGSRDQGERTVEGHVIEIFFDHDRSDHGILYRA